MKANDFITESKVGNKLHDPKEYVAFDPMQIKSAIGSKFGDNPNMIDEGASSILYHYTSVRPALKILQTGEFELTSSYGNKSEEKITPPGYPYYMSTTRSKVGDYHSRYPGSHAVMFVLDGDKIAQKYKVKPVDYWEGMWQKDTSNQRTRESEDRVYSKTPTIPADSVLEIHQLVMAQDENRGPFVRNMAILAKKKGIPIFFYVDQNAWLLQDKRKSVPVSKLSAELGGQMPNTYHRPSRRVSSLEQWLELIMKSDKSQLTPEADKLRFNLVYYGARYPQEDQSLSVDLHNARKPGDTERPIAIKLIDYLRRNNMSTVDLKNALVAKWGEQTVTEDLSKGKIKDQIYGILIAATNAGPFDGGCVVMAEAIQMKYGGDIVVLVGHAQRDTNEVAQHAAVQLDNLLIDFSGAYYPKEFIKRFELAELAHAGGYINGVRPIQAGDLPDAVRDPEAAEQIASLLK